MGMNFHICIYILKLYIYILYIYSDIGLNAGRLISDAFKNQNGHCTCEGTGLNSASLAMIGDNKKVYRTFKVQ